MTEVFRLDSKIWTKNDIISTLNRTNTRQKFSNSWQFSATVIEELTLIDMQITYVTICCRGDILCRKEDRQQRLDFLRGGGMDLFGKKFVSNFFFIKKWFVASNVFHSHLIVKKWIDSEPIFENTLSRKCLGMELLQWNLFKLFFRVRRNLNQVFIYLFELILLATAKAIKP